MEKSRDFYLWKISYFILTLKSIIAVLLIGTALIGYTTISGFFGNKEVKDCSCDGIEDMIEWAEGKRSWVYKDSLGIPTIGIGFNLNRPDARSVCSTWGINYDTIYSGSECLSDTQISCLFDFDLIWAQAGATKLSSLLYTKNIVIIYKY